jgi:hypothetical protein
MEQALAVEIAVETPEVMPLPEQEPTYEEEQSAAAPDFGHFGNEHEIVRLEIEVEARLFKAAPEYRDLVILAAKKRADAGRIREKLAHDFAIYKAIKVGRGRDGEWGAFVEKLGFKTRTVDRWVSDKIKLASGELPAWVVAKLKSNQDPEPTAAPTEAKIQPLELLLVGLSDEQKIQFNEAMDKFPPEAFALFIFEAVTTHPIALAPKVERKRMTFRDDDSEIGGPEPPTILEKLEQGAAA